MNIHEILKSFRAPLSEEQAWAVCYQCARELISKREESFQNLQPQFIDVNLETTRIRKDGSIEFTTVSSERLPQKADDVLFRLGSLVYECLDYGMEAFMERELDPSLERLILDMTCEQGDEGISVPEEFERKTEGKKADVSLTRRERLFSQNGDCGKEINLEMVLQRCTDHLTEDISVPRGHFKAVCRALANEALELSEFLRQLYNGSTLMQQNWRKRSGFTNWAYLQSLHASEWAKLWLLAMRELREGVTLRHVVHTKLPPASFEMTPFEMLLDDIRYHRFQLNPVFVTAQRKKEDAHDIILDFIRSRPPLTKTSERKMKPKPKISPNLHEKLLNEIRSGKQLKNTPDLTLKTVRDIYLQEICPSPEGSPYVTPKRKCLKPEIQLAESISRWDSPSPVSEHSLIDYELETPKIKLFDVENFCSFESSVFTTGSFKATCYELQKQKRNSSSSSSISSLEDDCVQNVRFRTSFDILPYEDRPLFPPSLRSLRNLKVTSKIYMTLKEVKHMRKTLAKLELEALDPDELLFKDLRNGKLCFCCQKRKFSLFGNWSRGCEVCESKVCIYCIHKLEPSISHVFLENSDINRRDSGFCDAYWPFVPSIPTTQSSPSLGAALTEAKTHKVCSSCKRFIAMYC